MASSLEHLGTDHIDSYVLHGPSSGRDGRRMTRSLASDAARARCWPHPLLASVTFLCGIWSKWFAARAEHPAFVQNRCYARLGWDREVRTFCRERKIVYQGFSLLTANQEVLRHPPVIQLAESLGATVAQVIFAFARAVGMLPLTGTSDPNHMQEDLASLNLTLTPDAVRAIEGIAG